MLYKMYFAVLLVTVTSVFAFSQPAKMASSDVPANSDPSKDSEVRDLSQIAKIKIHLPKSVFTLEETFKVDIGILVTAEQGVYLPEDLRLDIKIFDSRGRQLKAQELHVGGLVREMDFQALKNAYLVEARTIIIGCRSKSLLEEAKRIEAIMKLDTDDPKDSFNVGIFQPIASHCVDAKQGARFTMYLELFNDTLNKRKSDFKTAIGSVRSNRVQFSVR